MKKLLAITMIITGSLAGASMAAAETYPGWAIEALYGSNR